MSKFKYSYSPPNDFSVPESISILAFIREQGFARGDCAVRYSIPIKILTNNIDIITLLKLKYG